MAKRGSERNHRFIKEDIFDVNVVFMTWGV